MESPNSGSLQSSSGEEYDSRAAATDTTNSAIRNPTFVPNTTHIPPTRNPKKRTRASRRAPTTVLTTDTTNFRAMVQEFTGIPAPPFSPPSSFHRSRIDLFGSSSSSSLRSAPYHLPQWPFGNSLNLGNAHTRHPDPILTSFRGPLLQSSTAAGQGQNLQIKMAGYDEFVMRGNMNAAGGGENGDNRDLRWGEYDGCEGRQVGGYGKLNFLAASSSSTGGVNEVPERTEGMVESWMNPI